MEFQNLSIDLNDRRLLQLPIDEHPREITFDRMDQDQSAEGRILCCRIHLVTEGTDVFAYLLKNINPNGIWYEKNVRDGDRLMRLNGQDTTHMSYENVYSIMTVPFTCQVVWHPDLYLEFNKKQKKDNSNGSSRLIDDQTYAYFSDMIHHLLNYRPKEPYQFVKRQELSDDLLIESSSWAQKQFTLLSNRSTMESNPEETMRNLLEENTLFEQIGIGLNRDEIYWIWLLMKTLIDEKPTIQKLRFWGKIFGLKKNYYIVEAEFETFDQLDLNDAEFIKYQQSLSPEEEEDESNEDHMDRTPDTQSVGHGINQKIFFVSSGVEQSFAQLPLLTPVQIELSRRIQQFFTGDLEAPIRCDFSYPGVEKHLLHAQIQRISAGTQIAPNSYHRSVNNEEELDEESAERKIHMEMNNQLEDLSLTNGQSWQHYVPSINSQDRISISQMSINEDNPIIGSEPAWSVGLSSTLVPEHTLVYVRSNRWPGAFTLADRHHFENIYIGWGMKNFLENHSVDMIDTFPTNEYAFEILELDDPTIDEENELLKSTVLFSPDENEQFEEI